MWVKIPGETLDSIVKLVDYRTKSDLSEKINLRAGFFDKFSNSVFLITGLDSFDTSGNSTSLQRMAEYYKKKDSTSVVKPDIFLSAPYQIYQLMVISNSTVLIRMVFSKIDQLSPVFEFTFFIPKPFYSQKVKTIESVVGSLQINKNIN